MKTKIEIITQENTRLVSDLKEIDPNNIKGIFVGANIKR